METNLIYVVLNFIRAIEKYFHVMKNLLVRMIADFRDISRILIHLIRKFAPYDGESCSLVLST